MVQIAAAGRIEGMDAASLTHLFRYSKGCATIKGIKSVTKRETEAGNLEAKSVSTALPT